MIVSSVAGNTVVWMCGDYDYYIDVLQEVPAGHLVCFYMFLFRSLFKIDSGIEHPALLNFKCNVVSCYS